MRDKVAPISGEVGEERTCQRIVDMAGGFSYKTQMTCTWWSMQDKVLLLMNPINKTNKVIYKTFGFPVNAVCIFEGT